MLDLNFLIVVFYAGLGGNHCRNLLQTSPKISVDHKEISIKLLEKYSGCSERVHFGSNLLNLDKTTNTVQSVISNCKLDIVNVGVAHSINSYRAQELKKLKLVQAILFSTHTTFELKRSRDSYLNRTYNQIMTAKDTPECCIPVMHTVDANVWCSQNGISEIIKLDQKLNLDLDYEFCQQLHFLWYNKIFSPYQ
jgi:hypothetical protein